MFRFQGLVDSGVEDYTCFLFCGLCQSELNEQSAAERSYLLATKLDSQKLAAWQVITNQGARPSGRCQ